ncbi:MAG: GNAT family N-acetyltransferase [Alphaproteobacteria bacterium]|nr:GNAT family N-acetyltransferase [Alphaproteobacteria bacterium]
MAEFDIRVRTAEPSDAIGLARVQVETWRDAYVGVLSDDALIDLDEMQAAVRWTRMMGAIAAPERLAVADHDGQVVGFAHGGVSRRAVAKVLGWDGAVGVGEVYALYVDPNYQGMGIGRALLADVARRLATHGFDSLAILTLEKNRHGRRFYEALGGAAGDTVPSVVGGLPADQIPYFWPDLSYLVQRIETAAS